MLTLLLLSTALASPLNIEEICETAEPNQNSLEESPLRFEWLVYQSVYVADETVIAGNVYQNHRQFLRKTERLHNIYGRPDQDNEDVSIWIEGPENFPHYSIVAYKNFNVIQLTYECGAVVRSN